MSAIRNLILAVGLSAGLLAGGLFAASPASATEEIFPTPDAASAALIDAANNPGQGKLDVIFGDGGRDLFASGDPEIDKQRIADFLELVKTGTSVTDGKDGEKLLVFGAGGWQFPVPLKKVEGGWSFDLAAGQQAVIDRAVGRNEVVAIDACSDFVAAQQEYFGTLHDDEPVQQYARRFLSTPGRHDGLYWAPESQTDRSPLGDRIAGEVQSDDGGPGTYHGYHFRILTRQGPDAPGGAYDYLVKDRLLAGYAMLAFPADWGQTGVMSFFCDQRGNVYQANLGPDTAKLADRILSFNPGPGWELVPQE